MLQLDFIYYLTPYIRLRRASVVIYCRAYCELFSPFACLATRFGPPSRVKELVPQCKRA